MWEQKRRNDCVSTVLAVLTFQKTARTNAKKAGTKTQKIAERRHMEFSEIEALAKKREKMPRNLNVWEQNAYQSVAFLTERYLLGRVSAETAREEMNEIRRQFSKSRGGEIYIKHCADLWLNIESAAREFAKERSIEAAEKMYAVIYNMKLPERNANIYNNSNN